MTSIPKAVEPGGPPGASGRETGLPCDAIVCVQWRRVLFFHFAIEPSLLRSELPPPFELELHEGRAIISIVALTKRRFRPHPRAPLRARLFPLLREQRLLNLRTYVRYRDEPGAFFFWSWLSRPLHLPLPDQPLGLTCGFAKSDYRHNHESGQLEGVVSAGGRRFAYAAQTDPAAQFAPCAAGSLSEFALERYTGYYSHRGAERVFRAGHPRWLQTPVPAQILHAELITHQFSWFYDAHFLEAHYAPGFEEVWLSGPEALKPADPNRRRSGHGPSGLFQMP